MRTPVTDAMINAQLSAGIAAAEQAVRNQVTQRRLTQAQFDAAVSYAYNTGGRGAGDALGAINNGDNAGGVRAMQDRIYIHPRDRTGRPGPAVRSQGLVNRRRDEAAPFQ